MVPTLWSRLICKIEQRESSALRMSMQNYNNCLLHNIVIKVFSVLFRKQGMFMDREDEKKMGIIVFSSCNFPRQRQLLCPRGLETFYSYLH